MGKIISGLMLALYLTFLTASGMYITDDIFEDEIFETVGRVLSAESGQLHVVGENFLSGAPSDIVVDAVNARVYDLLTGFPTDVSRITAGQSARVAYNAHGAAQTVWLHYGEDYAAVFSVVVSENIWRDGDTCVFLCSEGKYRVTLSQETVIIDPYLGDMSPQDIAPGQEFFVWVDMITASSPSHVYPEKVVLMND